jgi:hypothetical protein
MVVQEYCGRKLGYPQDILNAFQGICQLDITCFSPFVLAVPNGVWAVIAAYKLLEQSPTLLLKQLT